MEPATAPSLQDKIRTLSALTIHDQRLARKFENTLKQLTERQARRVAREEAELEKAFDLLEMHQEKDLTYDPSVDAFVFTNDEIATHLLRKDRLKEANDTAVRRYCG